MKSTGLSRLLVLLLVIAAPVFVTAQTTPKKTTKPATTKKVSKKKPAAKAGKVFICHGAGGYHFHGRKTCAVLAKCKGRVRDVTKQEAMGDWGKKQCKSCY